MKKKILYLWKPVISLGIIALFTLIYTSCKDDDGPTEEPMAIFQYLPKDDNFMEINFVNFSKQAKSYHWEFGDGTSSDEIDPVHLYSSFDTFKVELTAINSAGSSVTTKNIIIADPDAKLKILTSESGKTWKLIRNNPSGLYAYEYGPEDRSGTYWTFGVGGGNTFEQRPCLANDEFIFYYDGTYVFDDKGDTWSEGNGRFDESVAWKCLETTDPDNMIGPNGEDLSGWGSGTFSFTYTSSTDKLTVNGLGAHVGFYGAGTDQALKTPVASTTYNVTKLVKGEKADTLILETEYNGVYWKFALVHYYDPNEEPPLAEPVPVASFTMEENGLEVTFNNTSQNATSHLWDFGDGETSIAASPVFTYAVGGLYVVTYTATNSAGSQTVYQGTFFGEVDPVLSDIQGDVSKTWHLANQQFSIWVGSAEGKYDLWLNDQSWVNNSQCIFDDEFTLNNDGTYSIDIKNEMFVESGMGFSSNGCLDVASVPENLLPWTGGEFTYSFIPATTDEHAKITVNGTGAYLGMFKPANGKEIYAPNVSSITYDIYGYIDAGSKDYLLLTIDVSSNASKFWLLMLQSGE